MFWVELSVWTWYCSTVVIYRHPLTFWAIFTCHNHTKPECNLHFVLFLLEQKAHRTRIRVQNWNDPVKVSYPTYSNSRVLEKFRFIPVSIHINIHLSAHVVCLCVFCFVFWYTYTFTVFFHEAVWLNVCSVIISISCMIQTLNFV